MLLTKLIITWFHSNGGRGFAPLEMTENFNISSTVLDYKCQSTVDDTPPL